jgi:hypothetical protein
VCVLPCVCHAVPPSFLSEPSIPPSLPPSLPPSQEEAIPILLSGRNVLARAKNGTGKAGRKGGREGGRAWYESNHLVVH